MYRVLIADDEPIERTVLNKSINKYFPGQLEVFQAENGREAVELYEKYKCQIVILDIEMPGINGLEAAETIRKMDPFCSIVFLTAFDEFSYAKRAISVKALDYLLKPGEDEELIAVLEEGIRTAEEQKHFKEGELIPFETKADKDSAGMELATGDIRLSAVKDAIMALIANHYTEDLSLQSAAKAMNYSDTYFCKVFKHCFGKSFTAYLTEFRIGMAKQMLEDITINVKEISDKVGYRDSNYFTKVFKRIVGVTPSEYRIGILRKQTRAE